MTIRRSGVVLAGLLCSVLTAPVVRAQVTEGKTDPDGLTLESIKAALPEYFQTYGNGRARPADIPDVFGPGAVLTVGNVFMKITNFGHVGNFFTNLSSDPAGQWPGASGTEYLSTIRLAVAGVNPTATDPTAVRRVSYLFEWRPPSLQPEDRIYKAYDGIINGARFTNDDGDIKIDPFDLNHNLRIDEDFLDGHDNDGDGQIDEDYAAIGQEMFSCVMRDDTPQAINATLNEKHVPLGLEVKQLAWAYSIPGFTDFDVVEYTITNVSSHELDSVYVGWLVDLDCGPIVKSNFFVDDYDIPGFPQGDFLIPVDKTDVRYQLPHADVGPAFKDKPLCPSMKIHISGFSIADDDGDDGKTPGVPSFLLINHTIDPTGQEGPARVGFHSFRSFVAGTPYGQGGNPRIDQERFEFMSSGENVDPDTRQITLAPGDQKGDYVGWCSIGPWLHVPIGGQVQATIAFAVKPGTLALDNKYVADYQKYTAGLISQDDLRKKYPSLDNAITAQLAYEGAWEQREGFSVTDFHGRETPLHLSKGSPPAYLADCHDEAAGTTRLVSDLGLTWFDFDCDYCTGVYDNTRHIGLFHHTWNAEAPPPNPLTNLSTKYNYTDNPNRLVAPGGDHIVTLAWDNLSETTPDPKSSWFDCRGYRLWKVANWTRPVGSPGPSEDDWSLMGEYRLFSYRNVSGGTIADNRIDSSGVLVCPRIYIPNYRDAAGNLGPAVVPICLKDGDLWDRQSGDIVHPDLSLDCARAPDSLGVLQCVTGMGWQVGLNIKTNPQVHPIRYPVGRYRFVDHEVKNGFVYFYSVTAFDSTGGEGKNPKTELAGRRSAVEAEAVVPQAATKTGKNVWVVPNPYRGYTNIQQRPSSWDLTPNASDPTGTHIDFFGMPPGTWTLKIFTVSGDLVQVLHSDDSVNESLRAPVTDDSGNTRPGYNRQQDTANDGEARWNLISRNGQDVVSGIYLFTVESSQGVQRGHFVIIR
ncbi:MAG: hypothetical protein HYR73_06220 [Candidatus Eisenbacteria bacterium]|nr:hypothetical protein [Candidatus Eisenbacteria bacterium]